MLTNLAFLLIGFAISLIVRFVMDEWQLRNKTPLSVVDKGV